MSASDALPGCALIDTEALVEEAGEIAGGAWSNTADDVARSGMPLPGHGVNTTAGNSLRPHHSERETARLRTGPRSPPAIVH
eukprot:4358950-Prymnesium_polylepis.1